jgi:hypothetical protein
MQFQTLPTTAWHRHIAAIARYIPVVSKIDLAKARLDPPGAAISP